MLTQPQLQRFAHESGIRNLEIVEKEVVLTYFLQLLSERGFLAEMAFKGGTCIRKTWLGPNGRFSTKPADLPCLRIEEILAEKIRAAYQRNKPRDIWDLDRFAERPLYEPLIRKLVIIKLWQARDSFSPERWNAKLNDARAWNWDDLRQLVRGGVSDPQELLNRCSRRFAFLADMNADEAALAADPYQRKHDIHQELVAECRELAREHMIRRLLETWLPIAALGEQSPARSNSRSISASALSGCSMCPALSTPEDIYAYVGMEIASIGAHYLPSAQAPDVVE